MLSTVVHFLNRDCGGSLILLISMFTFKFEFIPKGYTQLMKDSLNAFILLITTTVLINIQEHTTTVISCFQVCTRNMSLSSTWCSQLTTEAKLSNAKHSEVHSWCLHAEVAVEEAIVEEKLKCKQHLKVWHFSTRAAMVWQLNSSVQSTRTELSSTLKQTDLLPSRRLCQNIPIQWVTYWNL